MLAVERPLGRASVSTESGPDPVDTDECVRARTMLQAQKRRVPEARRVLGARRWRLLVDVPSPMERRNAAHPVINRAYHKMHEIALSCALDRTRRSAHLCEAPGGFVQCVSRILAADGDWRWTAVTLGGAEAPVPSDLLPLSSGGFVVRDVLTEADACASDIGTVDLVTADGAIEVDHARIDLAHVPLLGAQSALALRCLERGGTFVIKVFECLHPESRALVAWVSSHFESTAVIKPLSSRPTNSERYFVFRRFVGRDAQGPAPSRCYVARDWDVKLQETMATMAVAQADELRRVLAHQNS